MSNTETTKNTPAYAVKNYIHGAELVSPDGEEIAFFANRIVGGTDGRARAEKVAELLNDALALQEQIEAADHELAAQKARADAAEKEAAELRTKVERYEAAFKAANGTEAANG